jgi:hypothetical protein
LLPQEPIQEQAYAEHSGAEELAHAHTQEQQAELGIWLAEEFNQIAKQAVENQKEGQQAAVWPVSVAWLLPRLCSQWPKDEKKDQPLE